MTMSLWKQCQWTELAHKGLKCRATAKTNAFSVITWLCCWVVVYAGCVKALVLTRSLTSMSSSSCREVAALLDVLMLGFTAFVLHNVVCFVLQVVVCFNSQCSSMSSSHVSTWCSDDACDDVVEPESLLSHQGNVLSFLCSEVAVPLNVGSCCM